MHDLNPVFSRNLSKVSPNLFVKWGDTWMLKSLSPWSSGLYQKSSGLRQKSFGPQQNKCSVGLETSIPEIEKLKAQLPFLREDFSFPRLDSPDRGKEKSSWGKGRGRELFYRGYTCFMPYRYIFSTSQTSWPQPKVYEIIILKIWKPWEYGSRSKIKKICDQHKYVSISKY